MTTHADKAEVRSESEDEDSRKAAMAEPIADIGVDLFSRFARGMALARTKSGEDSESECEEPKTNEPCVGISSIAQPTETVRFSILLDLPSAPGNQEPIQAEIACTVVKLTAERVRQSVEVHFTQEWTLSNCLRGDLARVITLAPSERVRLSASRRRVGSLQRTTTEATEETLSSEDVSSAKEIYSVSRNSVRSRNWSVDARATIPIYGVEISLGGQIGEQASSTVNSALNEVTESTQRSSEQLRTSTKVEVKEASETTTAFELGRLLQNPYGDRSIDVYLYEVLKRYCVELHVSGAGVALRIDSLRIVFDQAFLRRNSAFLFDEMLDQDLASEMSVALAAATTSISTSSTTVSDRLTSAAQDALYYLFQKPNIFNVKTLSGRDANLPATTFDARLRNDGFEDAREEGAPLFFTTLNFFYSIYVDQSPSGDRAVELALSIYESVGRRWLMLMDADGGGPDLRELLDENNFTECLRRLSGFAAFVEGAVKPLVSPSELERETLEQERAAQATLKRVVEHLECNRRYYVERFLQYLSTTTRGRALADFVDAVLASGLVPANLDTSELSVRGAYVDGTDVVVPGRDLLSIDWLEEQLRELDPEWNGRLPTSRRNDVIVSADGLHAEPVETPCTLSSLQPEARPIADQIVVVDGSVVRP